MATEKVVAHLYGPRNQITAQCVVPAHMVEDFDQLLAELITGNPAFTPEWVVRYIWVRGLESLRNMVAQGTFPNPHHEPKSLLQRQLGKLRKT